MPTSSVMNFGPEPPPCCCEAFPPVDGEPFVPPLPPPAVVRAWRARTLVVPVLVRVDVGVVARFIEIALSSNVSQATVSSLYIGRGRLL